MKAIYSELKRVQMRPTAARVAVLKLFHDEPAAHGFHYQAYRHVLFGACADCESAPNAAVH
ncbi:hypothetical protein ACS0ZG_10045 [Burkholderia gladioli]|uniref:hypothetical protein n=1 Tax=Burkholderia gladioli TaxID=28095 RepID=UPI000649AD87|nr:hypothetical protein [Burkholderia gladioli]